MLIRNYLGKKKKFIIFFFVSLNLHGQTLPNNITDPDGYNHRVFFNPNCVDTTIPPDGPDNPDCFSATQAQNVLNSLANTNASVQGNPDGYENGYLNLNTFLGAGSGFDTNLSNSIPGGVSYYNGSNAIRETFVWRCTGGCDSGNAPLDRINLPSSMYRNNTEPCIRLVIGHELFHHIQYNSTKTPEPSGVDTGITSNWLSWGRELFEGTARYMQDKIYTDLDQDTGCITFLSSAQDYLGSPNRDLLNLSYETSLFWSYLGDRLGENSPGCEPNCGSDFVEAIWNEIYDQRLSPNFVGVLRDVIEDYDPNESLENIFHDFAITNLLRSYDLSELQSYSSDLYTYVDERDGALAAIPHSQYGDVDREEKVVGDWVGETLDFTVTNLRRWGVKYYTVEIPSSCQVRSKLISFTGDVNDLGKEDPAWGIFPIHDLVPPGVSDKAKYLSKAIGSDLKRSYLGGSDIKKFGLVVAAFDDAINSIDIKFQCVYPEIEVVRPTKDHIAYVAPDSPILSGSIVMDPRDFLLRLKVKDILEGTLVEGLSYDAFKVFVGEGVEDSNEASVLTGSYVQGEYWLIVNPPPKLKDNKYDLHVLLDSVGTKNIKSVSYDVKSRNQVIVIDNSGSMASGDPVTKLKSSQNAASLFVDTTYEDEKLGLVNFNGNNDSDDGSSLDDSKELLVFDLASLDHRQKAHMKINTLSPEGWTSIGDGLERARQMFADDLTDNNWMVLLSDGKGNEPLFWDDVSGDIIEDGVKIEAIAFGPGADEETLQSIAFETGGSYYYVNDPPSTRGLKRNKNRSLASNSSQINLFDAYSLASERSKRHERIWEYSSSGKLGAWKNFSNFGSEILKEAILSISWEEGGNTKSTVYPSPSSLRKQGNHRVYFFKELDVANLNLNLSEISGDYLITLSGLPVNKVGLDLHLGGKLESLDVKKKKSRQGYLRGNPIQIIAKLWDEKGAIKGLNKGKHFIEVKVIGPFGDEVTLPLFDDGAHGDYDFNDGIYANVYRKTTLEGNNISGNCLSECENQDDGDCLLGSYQIEFKAQGRNNKGDIFTRIRKNSFNVTEVSREVSGSSCDGDSDEMPTRYEIQHKCLEPYKSDAKIDADGDNLTNIAEWWKGTDPCNPDTDGGGVLDGYDVLAFDARDDILPKPVYVSVVNPPLDDHLPLEIKWIDRANLLRFPVVDGASVVIESIKSENDECREEIFSFMSDRFTTLDSCNFGEKNSAGKGLCWHKNLDLHSTYCYRVYYKQKLKDKEIRSAKSRIFAGKVKLDSNAPSGSIWINGGASHTDLNSPFVITINASDGPLLPGQDLQLQYAIQYGSNFPASPKWQILKGSQVNISSTNIEGVACHNQDCENCSDSESCRLKNLSIDICDIDKAHCDLSDINISNKVNSLNLKKDSLLRSASGSVPVNVCVKLKDSSGNESDVYCDSIIRTNEVKRFLGRVKDKNNVGINGVFVSVSGCNEVPGVFTDHEGYFELYGMIPDTNNQCTLLFDRCDYTTKSSIVVFSQKEREDFVLQDTEDDCSRCHFKSCDDGSCKESCLFILPGDATLDGQIDILDIIKIVNSILGVIRPTQEEFLRMDINQDKIINLLDLVSAVNLILEN